MPVGDEPITIANAWKAVTVVNDADRSGPAVKRIAVPGGWLYIVDHAYPTAPVFVPDRNRG